MDEQLKSNLTSSKHWVRFLYMILFAFFLYIASFFMVILVVVQFVFALLTGAENTKLRVFGRELTLYIHQTLMFLTYNTDFKPFPFADWPGETATAIVPERDPVHEQEPDQAQSKPEAPRTPDADKSARHTTAADAQVESPLDTEPMEVTAATSLIDVEPEAEEHDTQKPPWDGSVGSQTEATEIEAADTVESQESLVEEPVGNDRKTTRTRKKPE